VRPAARRSGNQKPLMKTCDQYANWGV
jgi:hypothetical protein